MSEQLIDRVQEDYEALGGTICDTWMYEAIRHVVRNCYDQVDCNHGVGQCNTPDKYDGARIARLVNAIPDLLNEIHRLKNK